MLKRLNFSKKASGVLDTIFIIVALFIFVFLGIMGSKVLSEVKTDIQADVTGTEGLTAFNEVESRYNSTMDGVILFAFCLLWIAAIITSFLLDSHPIFFITSITLLIFLLIAGAIMGNFYEEFMSDAEWVSMTSALPISYWIMTNILLVTVFVAFTIAGSLYAKFKLIG